MLQGRTDARYRALLAPHIAAFTNDEIDAAALEQRKADNAVVRANEEQAPVPVEQVLSPGGDVDEDDEWRVVTATGTYATDDTVIVRYRTREGASGVDVVVPLVTGSENASGLLKVSPEMTLTSPLTSWVPPSLTQATVSPSAMVREAGL